METIDIITGLDEAIRIIINARQQLAGGSNALWSILSHAENHLNKQIVALLAEVN